MQSEYEQLDARINEFKYSDAQRDQLLAQLVLRLKAVEKSHKELSHDYENERTFRRHWQDKHDIIERDLAITRQSAENNCFVQVLIDGDASYFHESIIQEGEKGGVKVAAELCSEIKKYIDTLFPGSDLGIVLHMYANLGGLSGMLVHNKIIQSPAELYYFARGFNNSQDMFNLVDVGSGKEQADHKLREMFRIFLGNKQCKHIIFAGCHDNGYLNILRSLIHDPEKSQRITLLETLPAQPGFKALNFNMISFPQIFKTEQPRLAAPSPILRTLPIRSPSPPKPASPAPGTWSAKTNLNGSTPETINIAPTKSKAVRYILQNGEGYRLDDKIPPVPTRDITSLKEKRESNGNFCNEHYLYGACTNRERCSYVHNVKLTAGEINSLRVLARSLTCSEQSYCEDYACYHGHSCPFEIKGKKCLKDDNCYFYELHGMDLHPTVKIFEDGRREKL